MPLGCDTATKLTQGTLQTLVNEKYTFVGRYLNALTPEERTYISREGLFIVSLYEWGNPTHIGYFTAAPGKQGRGQRNSESPCARAARQYADLFYRGL